MPPPELHLLLLLLIIIDDIIVSSASVATSTSGGLSSLARAAAFPARRCRRHGGRSCRRRHIQHDLVHEVAQDQSPGLLCAAGVQLGYRAGVGEGSEITLRKNQESCVNEKPSNESHIARPLTSILSATGKNPLSSMNSLSGTVITSLSATSASTLFAASPGRGPWPRAEEEEEGPPPPPPGLPPWPLCEAAAASMASARAASEVRMPLLALFSAATASAEAGPLQVAAEGLSLGPSPPVRLAVCALTCLLRLSTAEDEAEGAGHCRRKSLFAQAHST